MGELPDNPTACVVCDSYIGGAGHREGRGPKDKVCAECSQAGKAPDGYVWHNGSLITEEMYEEFKQIRADN